MDKNHYRTSMDKNHSSNSSMCKKIRVAIATSPAFRAIYRVSSYHHHQESRPNSNSPPPSQTKPSLPQHPKGYSTGGAGIIPIKFDYSTPTSHVAAKVEPEPPYISRQGKPPAKAAPLEAQNGHGHGKSFESAFTEYLEHNKQKIISVPNAGGGQSKAAPDKGIGTKKNDDHKDHFTDFIERAKKKIRTTSSLPFKRG